ncbi:MAG: hypothetical protein JWO99_108 [Candidatus Saccharibacteria bacterium]|nr:hypothetical protein [Candidatus Saccharibacteria bacterium]
MDITPQDEQQQPISDDQELAKALAGVMPDVPDPVILDTPATAVTAPASVFPEPPAPGTTLPPLDDASLLPEPTALPTPSLSDSSSSDLDSIKKNALEELRPLIDRVDLPAEEKFDTYLMLIRSTDDASLIAPAHTVAQLITDEKRRAEALLDIIKEIDYLSRNNQPAA